MSVGYLLFSLEGRVSRSTYWLKWIVPQGLLFVALLLLDMSLGSYQKGIGLGLLSGIYALMSVVPNVAMQVKRAHDLGRSGWFVALGFVPVLQLWPLIQLMFAKGTDGTNDYGPDPLSFSEEGDASALKADGHIIALAVLVPIVLPFVFTLFLAYFDSSPYVYTMF